MESIRERAMVLNAYADIMQELERKEKWYQHTDDTDPEKFIDDDYPESKAALIAIRETMKAVKKLAGV